MKISKQILSVACVLALIVTVFAGCQNNSDEYSYYSVMYEESNAGGSTEKGDASKTEDSSKATSKVNKTDNGKVDPKDYKGRTVTFATWDRAEGFDTDKAIIDFRKKYGINVQIKKVAQATYVQEVFALNKSGQGPDIVRNWDYWPAFTTIAQPIEVAKMDLKSSIFDQSHVKASTVNGKAYSVTSVGGEYGIILYYNKKLLQSNGIATPDQLEKAGKWNYTNLETIMTKAKALGKTYFGGYIDYYGLRLLDAYGTGIYKYRSGKFSTGIADSSFEKIATKVAKWNKAELLASGRETFISGKAAIAITDNYGLRKTGYWKDMNPADVGFIKLPSSLDGVKYNKNKLFTGFGIGKKSKEPVAAGIFLQFYLSPDISFQQSGYISPEAFTFANKLSGNSTDVVTNIYKGPLNALGNDTAILKEIAFADPTQVSTVLKSYRKELTADATKLNSYLAKNTK